MRMKILPATLDLLMAKQLWKFSRWKGNKKDVVTNSGGWAQFILNLCCIKKIWAPWKLSAQSLEYSSKYLASMKDFHYLTGKKINSFFYLRTKAANLMTAGTKDKRAITSQLVTVKNTEPLKILNSVRNNPKMAVGNFSFTKQPLQLGNLKVRHVQIHFFFLIYSNPYCFYRVIVS